MSFKINYYLKRRIHNLKYLKAYRRALRKHRTPAEAYLWAHLKARKLAGRRFNRQFSIENYITDFYCHQERLVIELDGQVHMNPTTQEKDRLRTARLNELGYTVVRFENYMVFEHLSFVLGEIEEHFTSIE
ncbi:MAG: endonuclease domain-containing protein [Flavobacteriaceae bacterium]|nr:endonuclease domain-containing protein [Flavobacteriaceae bacterium]